MGLDGRSTNPKLLDSGWSAKSHIILTPIHMHQLTLAQTYNANVITVPTHTAPSFSLNQHEDYGGRGARAHVCM